ncbi:PRC-barrel domain-containing protein [Patulibacter minatonensis]|uniref:PRC-barrel domain-containing protein n=1 Tax=Patulibacter minatonensis TaxID=298163 RepID=UPI0006845FC7|nr:PRC-barrel domain-containing protein [Patulibacter minatonensis]
MTKLHEAADLHGRQVVGADGEKIGKIDEVLRGADSGEPAWAIVNTGLFGLRSSFVPIGDARDVDGALSVPYDKSTVKDAPDVDAEHELSPEEEQRLVAHYGQRTHDDVPQDSGVISPRESRDGGDAIGEAAPVDHERRGPEGPTGRSDTEDPVPPDGEAPPASGDVPAPAGLPHVEGDGSSDDVPKPPGAPDGREQPVSDVPKPAGAPDTDAARAHGLGHIEIPTGGAKATPESGPTSPSTAQDELEAPESPDSP